jgi:hypothetical protein
MFANRRSAIAVSLAVSLSAGTAVASLAGCGGTAPAVAPATTAAAPSAAATPSGTKQPEISQAVLQKLVNCMKSRNVTFSQARVTEKEVRDAFRSLSVARQQSVFAACGPILPESIRQAVRQRMTEETGGAASGPATSP